jgi:uncharacterized surface protein with fasciclin (FAS1) repeats
MTRNYPGILFFLTLCVAVENSACTKNDATAPALTPSLQTLRSTIQDNYSFSLFYYALKKTGLDQLLTSTTPHTLLVCDNDAFGRDSIHNTGDLDKLDTAYLRLWMSYHILPGKITSASVPQAVNNAYTSISGQILYFSRPLPTLTNSNATLNGVMHINGDTVSTLDLTASDGVIQVLNRPLTLPVSSVQAYLSSHSQYSELVTGLQHFGLWDQLSGPGPFTIWAPDNDAFTAASISPDSVSKLDTVRFANSLFKIYVLKPARVFLTDFIDIDGGWTSAVFFAQDNGPYVLESSNSTSSAGYFIDSYGPTKGYPAPWTTTDILAVNGTIQGIGGLLLRPDQTRK